MSQKIQLLPEIVANQIAAGEVIEGPSSIIKELFENSVDAKASKIDIQVSKNFLKLELTDNGEGITKEDLSLAFKKHATSKIKKIEDLDKILTQGFRGEALASISAVSKLTCITKTKTDEHAHKIYIENEKEEITETGAGLGTKIIIDELFFNTPARLKFLKSNSKERNLIIDCCRGLALANPQIALSLSIDGKEILESSGSGKLNTCLEEIFKKDISKQVLEINFERNSMQASGYCSKPSNTRTDRRGIFSIVNGRILDCYIIKSALNSVYKEILPSGKYPIAVVKLELNPEDIDVNVHPNKKEVKYRDANKVYSLVQEAVDKALRQNAYQEHEQVQAAIKDIDLDIKDEPKEQTRILESPKPQTKFEFKTEAPKSRPVEIKAEEETKFDFNSKKFIARFGSIDIKVVDNLDAQSNISAQGNKTKFDYVHKVFKENKSVVFQGDFVGENWMKEKLFSFLSELAEEIVRREEAKTTDKKTKNRSRPQSKPSKTILAKIWQRDNYTCVYCSKALLDPSVVKEKLVQCSDADELNSHLASYDHHLPASKFAELNKDEDNLFAVCQECNIKKSDSLASKTWTPNRQDAWSDAHVIADIEFSKPTL